MTTDTTRRYYYRCTGCLEVYALPTALQLNYSRTVATCENCRAHLEFMGRVEMDRLVKDEFRCKCDDRCTSARGPICSCHCGGKNHGASVTGYVRVTVDAGSVPTVTAENPFRLTKSLEQYRRFRRVIEPLIAERDALLDKKERQRLTDPEYRRFVTIRAIIRKALDSRSHNGRMKILEPYAPAPVVPSTPVRAVADDVTRAIATAPPIAEVPFALTPQTAQRKNIQTTLF